MLIPWNTLEETTLDNLIKEYIYRELEDHQLTEMTLDKWIQQLKLALKNNQLVIEWSEEKESVNFVDAKKYAK